MKMTLGELRKELGVYNKTINNFLDVFGLEHNNRSYVVSTQANGIRDYQEITENFVSALKSYKDQLVEFERDYYSPKTITEISINTRLDVATLLEFVKERFGAYLIERTKENSQKPELPIIDLLKCDERYMCGDNKGVITPETKLRYISSYKILKLIQLEKLRATLGIKRHEIVRFASEF